MYGNPETTPGGRALKYFSSVRIDIRRIESIKVAGEMTGNRTRARVIKNKVAPPFKEAEFDIIYGEGISKAGEIIDLGVKYDIIDKGGAWYTVGDERIQGRENAKQYLLNNPELMDSLEAELKDVILNKKDTDEPKKERKPASKPIAISAEDFED